MSRRRNHREGFLLIFLPGLMTLSLLLSMGCAGPKAAQIAKEEPMPPAYYPEPERKVEHQPGSLWSDGRGLFKDRRACMVNDLVTIKIIENATGTKSATTDTERTSSEDRSVSAFLGLPLDLNMRDFMGMGSPFSPEIAGGSSSKHKGKGTTNRNGSLTAFITAKVADILPNGNLVLEARKETLINNENQILVLRGIVRPTDIASDNTVLSTFVADARISFTGDGVLDDRQMPGWGTRILDVIWPF